ncbi:MAG: hypothetical protein E7F82_12010 [Escherichia coli]|nr:hypothetical protein [Escherichia coli]
MRRKRLIRPTKITPNQAIALSGVGLIRRGNRRKTRQASHQALMSDAA